MNTRGNQSIYAQLRTFAGDYRLSLIRTVPESETARTGISGPHPSLNINAEMERDA